MKKATELKNITVPQEERKEYKKRRGKKKEPKDIREKVKENRTRQRQQVLWVLSNAGGMQAKV